MKVTKTMALALAGLVVALPTACGTGGAGSDSPSRLQAATSAARSQTATLGTPSTTTAQSGQPASAAYASALAALEKAPTVTYSVNSTLDGAGVFVQTDREVSVDAGRELASTRARLRGSGPGRPKADHTMLVITTRDSGFLNMPDWTDARRGKWMKFTTESAASMGVSFELGAPSTVPPGLAEFSATTIRDGRTIEGTLEAESGLGLLGINRASKDPEFRASLTGRIPAVVTIDPRSGAIVRVDVTGKGNTVQATSSAMPSGALEAVSLATATITIIQTGKAVKISVPAAKDVVPD